MGSPGSGTSLRLIPKPDSIIDATERQNWMGFDQARRAALKLCDGVGIALGEKSDRFGLVGIDLDHCVDDQGNISDRARQIVDAFGSYTERTPSGHGLRILLWGSKPGTKCSVKKTHPGIEIYEADRYITVTGRHLEGSPTQVAERPEALQALYDEMFSSKSTKATKPKSPFISKATSDAISAANGVHTDAEVLAAAAHADGFSELWKGSLNGFGSQSEADLSLVNRLAFYCGSGKDGQVKRLFLQSELGKRDKASVRPDYLDRTIGIAYAGRTEFYVWTPPASTTSKPAGNRPALSNCRTVDVPGKPGETKTVPRSAEEIGARLVKITAAAGTWPKRVDEALFVQTKDFRPVFLDASTQLFGFIDSFASVYWMGGPGLITQERFFEYLRKFSAQATSRLSNGSHNIRRCLEPITCIGPSSRPT